MNGEPPARDRAWAVLLVVVVLVPVVVAIEHAAFTRAPLLGDFALLDLRIRDVFTLHPPLVGVYSRYGWNHPGPLLFYAMAPFVKVLGGASWTTPVVATLLQGIAFVLVARLAWRLGGVLAVAGALLFTAVPYGLLGPSAMVAPWNPYIAMPFFALFVLQAWSAVTGDTRQVLWAAVVGTFLVQTHIGYLPFVGVTAVFVTVFLVRDRALRRPATVRTLQWTALALGVLWLPAVLDQVTGGANLRKILDYFEHPRAVAGVSIWDGARVFGRAFREAGEWLRHGEVPLNAAMPVTPPASWGWLALLAALLVLGALAAWRTGHRSDRRILALAALLCAVHRSRWRGWSHRCSTTSRRGGCGSRHWPSSPVGCASRAGSVSSRPRAPARASPRSRRCCSPP